MTAALAFYEKYKANIHAVPYEHHGLLIEIKDNDLVKKYLEEVQPDRKFIILGYYLAGKTVMECIPKFKSGKPLTLREWWQVTVGEENKPGLSWWVFSQLKKYIYGYCPFCDHVGKSNSTYMPKVTSDFCPYCKNPASLVKLIRR